MGNEHGEWIMHGMSKNDKRRIQSASELEKVVEEIGFLPLFQNDIPGFSVEERTSPDAWWSGTKDDPWEWRQVIARKHQVAYGKFFDKKAGFISKAWLPYFINFRRDGYDFDSLYEDGKAGRRSKKIMDLFLGDEQLPSFEIKSKAGFEKGGEKNFDGVITELQMQIYLVMCNFERKKNKWGEEYGWPVAVYTTPEQLWGYEKMTAAYKEEPQISRQRISDHMLKLFPKTDLTQSKMMKKMLK